MTALENLHSLLLATSKKLLKSERIIKKRVIDARKTFIKPTDYFSINEPKTKHIAMPTAIIANV